MSAFGENIINENVLLSDLPDGIKTAILQNRTSLGNNPAVPDIFDVPYLLKASEKVFNRAKDVLKEMGSIDDVEDTEIESALASLLLKCKKMETPYRNELEKICYNYVIDLFSVPEDSVDIKLELVDDVDTDRDSIILDPVDGDADMEFNDLNDAISIRSEVYKRRFLDVMCMGAAMWVSENISSIEADIAEINPELPRLYHEILALCNYSLFLREDLGMTDENKLQIGTFELRLGNDEVKASIESQGVVFPILLCETVRGFMELFISHGLPVERERAIAVLGKSDFLKAEPWDMRLGPHIWEMVSKSLTDVDFNDMPYLFKRISSLDTHKFNFLMKEVLAGTKKGRRIMAMMCNKAKNDAEYDKFLDRMDKMKADKGVITDDYIHADEF